MTQAPNIIIQYPTPENAGKKVYKDDAGVCYKYRTEEVEFPKDKSMISKIKLQHVSNGVQDTPSDLISNFYKMINGNGNDDNDNNVSK